MFTQNVEQVFAAVCLSIALSSSTFAQTAQPTTNLPSAFPTETRRPVSISGEVVLEDGSPLAEPVDLQRVCGNIVRGETTTDARGRFTIQMEENSTIGFQSASEGGGVTTMGAQMGNQSSQTTRTQLWGCEIRAVLPGYVSGSASLAGRDFSTPVSLGRIVLRRIGGNVGVSRSVSAIDLQAPDDARKEFEKAREDYFKKKYDDSNKHLDKAIKLYPKYASAHDLLGRTQRARRMDDLAESSFRAAIAADGKFVAPYLHLAALLATHGRWPEVIAASDKAIELDADGYAEPYYFKSVALLMAQRVPEAKISIGKVLEIDRDHRFPRAELMLGNILRSEGNAAAAEHLRNYLKMEPNGPDAAKIQDYLAKTAQEKPQAPQQDQR
jgi:tetratricopeptide (TPR) repeat protein